MCYTDAFHVSSSPKFGPPERLKWVPEFGTRPTEPDGRAECLVPSAERHPLLGR
jgi:hypothetical protein